MMLTPYQIVVPLLSLLAILYAWNLARRQKKTVWEAVLWTMFWGVIAIIALNPSLVAYLTLVTGIKSKEKAIVFTSIGIPFFMLFYMIIRLEELQQRQARMIRSLALRDADLSEEKKA